MEIVLSMGTPKTLFATSPQIPKSLNPNFNLLHPSNYGFPIKSTFPKLSASISCKKWDTDLNQNNPQDNEEVDNLGVKAALSMLKFYQREISPILPKSCRYVPSCSEYSMIAYKKYGVVKGTILTAWRLCRCNPLGGSGFDPPRWFDEERPLEE